MKNFLLSSGFGGLIIIVLACSILAQEKTDQGIQVPKENYLIGEEKNLEIIVHIWGEVRNPGEKRVPDGTNLMELISKAGGPTEFSNLSSIMLFSDQNLHSLPEQRTIVGDNLESFIINDLDRLSRTGKVEIDINNYLTKGKAKYLPRLFPGDVVHVKRNVWYKWQTFFRVASQVAIIAQVWYWYSRIE